MEEIEDHGLQCSTANNRAILLEALGFRASGFRLQASGFGSGCGILAEINLGGGVPELGKVIWMWGTPSPLPL
jgi:hypothetical protein